MKKLSRVSLKRLVFAFSMVGLLLLPAGMVFAETRVYLCDGEPCPSQDVNSVTKLMTFGLSRAGMFAFGMSFVSGQIAGAMKGPFGINLGSSVGDPLKKMNKTGTDRVKKTGMWRRQEEIAKDVQRSREANQAGLASAALTGIIGASQTVRSVGAGGKENKIASLSMQVATTRSKEMEIRAADESLETILKDAQARKQSVREAKIKELSETEAVKNKDVEHEDYFNWLALRQISGQKLDESEKNTLDTLLPGNESRYTKLKSLYSPQEITREKVAEALRSEDEAEKQKQLQDLLGIDPNNEGDIKTFEQLDNLEHMLHDSSFGLADISERSFTAAAESAQQAAQKAERQYQGFINPLGAAPGKTATSVDRAIAFVARQQSTKKEAVAAAASFVSALGSNSSPDLVAAIVQLSADPSKRSLMHNKFFIKEVAEGLRRKSVAAKKSNAGTNVMNKKNNAAYAHEAAMRSTTLGSSLPEHEALSFLNAIVDDNSLRNDPTNQQYRDLAILVGEENVTNGLVLQETRTENMDNDLKFNNIEGIKDGVTSGGRISLKAEKAFGKFKRDKSGRVKDIILPALSNLGGRWRAGSYDISVLLDTYPLQSIHMAAFNPEADPRNVPEMANHYALNGFLDKIRAVDDQGKAITKKNEAGEAVPVYLEKKEAYQQYIKLANAMRLEKRTKARQKKGQALMGFLLRGDLDSQTVSYDDGIKGLDNDQLGDLSTTDALILAGGGESGVTKDQACYFNKGKGQIKADKERGTAFSEGLKRMQDSRKSGVKASELEDYRKSRQLEAQQAGYTDETDIDQASKKLAPTSTSTPTITPQKVAQAQQVLAEKGQVLEREEDEDEENYHKRLVAAATSTQTPPPPQSGSMAGIDREAISDLGTDLARVISAGNQMIVEALEELPEKMALQKIGEGLAPILRQLQQHNNELQDSSALGQGSPSQPIQKNILTTLRELSTNLPYGMARITSQQLNQAGLSPQLSTIGQAFFSPQLEDKDRMTTLQEPNGISLLMAALKSGNPQLQQQAGAFAGRMLQGPDTQAQAINILSDVMQTSPVEGRALLGQITTSTSKDQLLGISTPILSSDDHTLRNEFARGVVISALPADTKSSLIEAFQSHPDSFLLTQETSAALMQQLPQVQDPYLKQQILGLVASRGDNTSAYSTVELLRANANDYSAAFGAVSADQYGTLLNTLNGPTGQNHSSLSLDIPPQAWETFARMTSSSNSALTAQKQEVFVEFLGQQLAPLQPASREAFLRESLSAIPDADVGNSELHKLLSSKINGQGRLLEHIDELLQQLVP